MISLFFSYSSTPYTDCYNWVTQSQNSIEVSQRLQMILQEGVANSLQDLCDKSLKERFIGPSGNIKASETISLLTETVFEGIENQFQTIESNPFRKEESGSDSDESIGAARFFWAQETSLKESNPKEECSEDFIKWITGTDFPKKDPIQMNCVQGVIYYICVKVPDEGQKLREQLRKYYTDLLSSMEEKDAKKIFFEELPGYLGFSIDNDSESDHETGPHNFSELDSMLKNKLISPYSVISFGNNRGDVHMVVMTKDLKCRSLWVTPDSLEKSTFGKYEPQVVFEQVKSSLSKLDADFKENVGIEDEVFYLSSRFVKE